MESQKDDHPRESSTSNASNISSAAPQHTQPKQPTISTSVPALRFPIPQGNQRLANWVSNSSPDILQPPIMSDTSSLADSAYEIINSTDGESQEDHLTESTGSLEVPRPDDVHSLDGSENRYDSDSDDDSAHSSRASSIRYADQVLQRASTTHLPTNTLQFGSPSEGSGNVSQSIEFQEEDGDNPIILGKISVKHAVWELDEKDTATITTGLNMSDPPKRLVAAIRQTMSQAYLSTKEPLRVLYVGNADAQRGIVLKISNAIWASPNIGARDEDVFGRHREGVYNIVPISSFGPTPELDLMEASHYQIKVEHCTSAREVIHEGASFPSDIVYSITIEHDKTYKSLFSPSGSNIQPKWTLPHIAIFYCAEDDDEEDERTKDIAWEFMNRHGVPSVFIRESQSFVKPSSWGRWKNFIDPHAVHVCLESRDPERPIDPQRFPIDLASFENIDARQMNRNLAYLTGLSEIPEETTASEKETQKTKVILDLDTLKAWLSNPSRSQAIETIKHNKWIMALMLPILSWLITSLLFAAFGGQAMVGSPQTVQKIPLSGVLGVSTATCAGFSATSSVQAPTSTSTVVINVTSTKTVQISHVQPSTSSLASALSFAGLLSDKPSSVPSEPEAKKTTCAAKRFSQTEILVTIPSGSKSSWLAKGAIDVDVYRGEELIKTKLSSVDEGILLELPAKDAYGALNVSVVTTRRPRINETFVVDFGKPVMVEAFEAGMHMLQDIAKAVSYTADGAVHLVEDTCAPASRLLENVVKAGKAAQSHCEETVSRLLKVTKDHMSRQIKIAEKMRDGVDISILQAQIASRLWWLKFQGKTEEYAEYERNASRFLRTKYEEMIRANTEQQKDAPKESWNFLGKLAFQRQKDDVKSRGNAKDSRWMKIVG
ncbi:hypothetical protein B0T17DRAFT_494992 [Bombardia bombarda]|uniref:Uncharacterized protein n=1 Tax=Bombardia bombarda TaxID=252184 RepID=A0AA39WTT1_9PEZI|nr:hypothetical protein B0T17DRAFT_494992 [Bombardia bombarda]